MACLPCLLPLLPVRCAALGLLSRRSASPRRQRAPLALLFTKPPAPSPFRKSSYDRALDSWEALLLPWVSVKNETTMPPPHHGVVPLFVVVVTATPLLAAKTAWCCLVLVRKVPHRNIFTVDYVLLSRPEPSSTRDAMAPSINTNVNDYHQSGQPACQVRRRSPPEGLPSTRTSSSPWVSSSSTMNPEVFGSVKSNNDCAQLPTTPNVYENEYHYHRRDRENLYRRTRSV
ncbi:hypothetical protein TRIUR3_32403 [Triticum urartu]|uniref:Uncharacterized protein n=1 Tax=Triticum urartu TaxID=4572 RepID=M8AJU3_TRIUA|nr:hypothetical protein TRIUR3_32403 [Triticum urartu]